MSRAIWSTERPDSGKIALRLHTHTMDFRSTVEDVLLLARWLHRAAAATVTQAERDVP